MNPPPHTDNLTGPIQTQRRKQSCRVLLIDETSIRKRHRYVTVILNGDTGELLDMIEGRSKAALSRFFIEQGPRWCHSVRTVVTDGSHSYRAAIHRYLPGARHVLDRFHAVRWFAQGLTLVRRELQRRQPPGVKPAVRTGPVPRPVRSPEKTRPPYRLGPQTPRPAIRRPSASSGRLGRSTRALQPLSGRRPPRRPRRSPTLRRPLRNRPDSRVPQHRGHHPQLVRRNPQLAPQPPFQRTPRRHQQPNPNPPQNRPWLHKPPKLRRPRTPPNMNPTTNQPDHNPTNSRRARVLNHPFDRIGVGMLVECLSVLWCVSGPLCAASEADIRREATREATPTLMGIFGSERGVGNPSNMRDGPP